MFASRNRNAFSTPKLGINFRDEICDCFEHIEDEDYYQNNLENRAMLVSVSSLKTKIQEVLPKRFAPKESTSTTAANPILDDDETLESETIAEPSAAVLAGITLPLIPTNVWNSLTGKEFFFPSTLAALIKSGIRTALPQSEAFIDWKPADSKTKKLLEMNDQDALRKALEDDDVLVWIGKFKEEGHGSHLPLIKTTSILPLSPKGMAELLMDSSKVPLYNKMSRGRSDEVVFQEGVDTVTDSGNFILDGCAKIVRNVSKPPLSKKLMDFVTVMYARRIHAEDNIGTGIMGASNDGYAVISRAVNGGKWGPKTGGDSSGDEEIIRSEILMGMNLIRSIPGCPDKAEVTAVTHCNSPSVPTMLAGSVGVKGAIDFVKDIRALYSDS